MVVGVRLDDHPRSILGQRLTDVHRSSNGIAHIMKAVENGYEIVVFSGEFFGLGDLKGHPIGDTLMGQRELK